ncbi:MAG TPA: glycosyl transferase family 2 [Flavobacteriaceae bacterium]|nr:glycosyl transferase family 2 [Flavobacteriaceae bacterium]
MFCAVIMPIYNEASHLDLVLQSFASQTERCDMLILVDDGSTDQSPQIQNKWAEQHPWIKVLSSDNTSAHAPGAKVVHAFYRGYEYMLALSQKNALNIALIGKFDGDVILPPDYFATLKEAFNKNAQLGLASGLLYIKKNKDWVYEQISKKQKIRGPIKLYRKACFDQIGGLRACLGWDSIDQWLVQFWGWQVETFTSLKVKHLKATGQDYRPGQLSNQGRAFAHMGYGFWLSLLSLVKLGIYHKNPKLVLNGLIQYWRHRNALMVSQEQAKFIRKSLWYSILNNR